MVDYNNYSSVKIPMHLLNLVETIAKEGHNRWVEMRMEQGFVYSEILDYDNKTHPHCQFWNELPEDQRQSDYLAARCAVQVMLKQGLLE